MPTNLSITTYPDQWSAAYDDVIFVFDFTDYSISSAAEYVNGSVGTGYTEITISGTFDITPVAGQMIYISSGTYLGAWQVLAGSPTTVAFNCPFSVNQNTGTLKHLRIPPFQLFKGFQPAEMFENELPYTFVTSFTPIFNEDYQVEINLSYLLQKIFTIEPPDINSDYDFSVFNAFRLVWDTDNESDIRFVINCSIPTAELNSNYLAGDRYLTNTSVPLLWGCGVSFMTKFEKGFPILEIYNNTNRVAAGFGADFNYEFSQGFNIN